MIYIGLCGWGDQDSLYSDDVQAKDKLAQYSSHFNTMIEMFDAFKTSLKPYQDHQKLEMVLFQFPPWFNCTKENINYIRYCKKIMDDIPVALEFRNQSWYNDAYREGTLSFMKEEGWIHCIADEPQAEEGSVPLVPVAIDPNQTLVRLHGRNVQGWNKQDGVDWREVRFLYEYNEKELLEWKKTLHHLSKQTKDIIVLFNNNLGRHAANNAKELQKILGIEYKGLAPKQLDLF